MMKKSDSQPERKAQLVLRSAVFHWDFWTALAVGASACVVLTATGYIVSSAAFVSMAVISITIAGLAWTQLNHLRDQLSNSHYGELLRMTDPGETEASLPYSITLYIALVSAAWSGIVASFIRVLSSRTLVSMIVGVSAFLLAWSMLALFSLVGISRRHSRNAAAVEAVREALAAAEREQRRRERATGHDLE